MRLSLELGFEPGQGFETFEDYQAGWERFRAQLTEEFNWGKRAQAWWDFDAPELGARQPHDSSYEAATLWEHDLLSPEEHTQLEKRWRDDFEDCHRPDWLGYCSGYDEQRRCALWIKGDAARQAHFKWAGIPKALVKRWTKQRDRRAKTIRKMAEPEPTPGGELPPAARAL